MRPVEDEQEEDNFGGDDGEEFVLGKASLALASVAGSAVPGGRCSTAGGTRCGIGRAGHGKFGSSRNVESNLKGRMTEGLGTIISLRRHDRTRQAWHGMARVLVGWLARSSSSFAAAGEIAFCLHRSLQGLDSTQHDTTRHDTLQRVATAAVVQTPEDFLPADLRSEELRQFNPRVLVQAETNLKSPCLVNALDCVGAGEGNGEQIQRPQSVAAGVTGWML
ncbi:hypothetical protein CCMA1212_009019 [Trichoderma ghanense]|uniref:Uncharacterized protein n=1 Tax=Trichoderma ghanense TaxID=65468 RepID=A0ABY2GTI7_9HYPO